MFVSPVYEALVRRAIEEDRRQAIAEADAEVTLEQLDAAFNSGEGVPMAEVFKLVEKYRG